jgi:hypothetical protein
MLRHGPHCFGNRLDLLNLVSAFLNGIFRFRHGVPCVLAMTATYIAPVLAERMIADQIATAATGTY